MNNEDIPIEDIVLLQLFKDNLLSSSLEQAKGVMFDSVSTVCPVSDSSALSTDDSSSLSDLDSVLSQDTRHHLPSWPEPECEESSQGYSNPPADVTETVGTLKNFGLSGKRLGKDEKLAKEAKIPFTVKTLVSLPMDEFNDLLSKNDLTEEQLNTCRDIRRRGKNKVAAQNCRQRKIEQIEELQIRFKKSLERRNKAKYEHSRLLSQYSAEAERLRYLTESVLKFYNKDDLNFTIQVTGEEVNILPKTAVKEECQTGHFSYSLNSLSQNENCITGVQYDPLYERKHYNNYF